MNCPHCGYCSHCGRSNGWRGYPWGYTPYWNGGLTYGAHQTTGNLNISGNLGTFKEAQEKYNSLLECCKHEDPK